MKNGYVSIFNVKVKPNGEHKLAFDYFGVGRFRDWKNSFSSYIWFYKDDKVYIVLNQILKLYGIYKILMVQNGAKALIIRVGLYITLIAGLYTKDLNQSKEIKLQIRHLSLKTPKIILVISEKINNVGSSITQNLNSIAQRVSENKILINSVNGNVTNVLNRFNQFSSQSQVKRVQN